MKTLCATCSMPLDKKEDVGLTDGENSFCTYCCDKSGKLRSAEQIFHGGVSFFMHQIEGMSLDLAERVTRRNMKTLTYWKTQKPLILEGHEATDEEYQNVMKLLGE